ncbi:MAG TPA: hypothetical protein VGJ28_19625 [Micromonosporaceae bacterium]
MPTVAQLFGEVDREQFVDPAASVGNEPVGGEDADDDEEADEIADLEGELTVAA